VFWIVKHGIRNTAMPALGPLLSDDDIGNLTSIVKQLELRSTIRDAKRDLSSASAAPE
jgi:mono/diheme cytochrome c family protein